MRLSEKILLGLTGLFLLACAGILLWRLLPGHAVTAERTLITPADAAGETRSGQERLNEILGIEETPVDTAGRININTATQEELTTLPGIGEVLAGRIIQYRETNGPFQDVSHIRDVTGIGDGIYAKIVDLIYAE